MKITYLRTHRFGVTTSIAKITQFGILCCNDTSIEEDEFTLPTHEAEVNWYKKELKYEECKESDFDKFFIKTVNKFNLISKI